MSQVLVTQDKVTAIADAIRTKLSETDAYTLDQMPDKIAGMSVGGLDYTVTFKVSDTAVAGFAVVSGVGMEAPIDAGATNWVTESGSAVTFPYTPTASITLIGQSSNVEKIYKTQGVSKEVYPYVIIGARGAGMKMGSIFFVTSTSTVSISGTSIKLVGANCKKATGQSVGSDTLAGAINYFANNAVSLSTSTSSSTDVRADNGYASNWGLGDNIDDY